MAMMILPERDPEGNETNNLRALVNLENRRVLEVGCGEGRLTWRYAAATSSTTAIDSDPARLAVARANCPRTLATRLTLVQARAEALPFPSTRFDVAILAWSL
jgi:ubiquinone/menaquinone biosynthesis C-methylase UbiE